MSDPEARKDIRHAPRRHRRPGLRSTRRMNVVRGSRHPLRGPRRPARAERSDPAATPAVTLRRRP